MYSVESVLHLPVRPVKSRVSNQTQSARLKSMSPIESAELSAAPRDSSFMPANEAALPILPAAEVTVLKSARSLPPWESARMPEGSFSFQWATSDVSQGERRLPRV